MGPASGTNLPLTRAHRGARRHGSRAAILFGVALAAAVASALLLTRYVERRMESARVPTAKVVVAQVDLPVGAEIRPEHLRVVEWPLASRPEGCFEDPAVLATKVVASHVYRQEPILASRLAGYSGSGLSALLQPGMRAAAVRVDDVVGVAGFLHPGDSVDVIATLRADGGHGITSSKVILQNIRVLAVGKELDHKAKGSEKVVQATVATLQVDAEQSERLALGATHGKLLLTLRSPSDVEVVATPGMTATALLEMPAASVARAAHPRVARAAAPPPRPETAVEILRGELFERRKFAGEAQ